LRAFVSVSADDFSFGKFSLDGLRELDSLLEFGEKDIVCEWTAKREEETDVASVLSQQCRL
jgi:hypothetical protein